MAELKLVIKFQSFSDSFRLPSQVACLYRVL